MACAVTPDVLTVPAYKKVGKRKAARMIAQLSFLMFISVSSHPEPPAGFCVVRV